MEQDPQLTVAARGTSARATWDLLHMQNYVYDITQTCYCALPRHARVRVMNDRVVAVHDLDKGKTLAEVPPGFRTISQWFDWIGRQLAKVPDRVELHLDRQLGYPAKIDIDPSYFVADDGIHVEISRVRRLVPHP